MAQYSIETNHPDHQFATSPPYKQTPLAPLVFEVSRINPVGDHDSNCALLGINRSGGVHSNAAGSSSSSLSLSSGSLGGGGVIPSTLHSRHSHHHRPQPRQSDQFPTSSVATGPRHHRTGEFPENHLQQNQFHQRPLKEIDIPPAGESSDFLMFALLHG